MAGITVRGIPEVQQNLRDFPRKLAINCFRKALGRAAAVFEAELRARCPEADVASSDEYGKLIDNLISTITLDLNGRGGRMQVGFGRKDFVAIFVEYGHRMVAHGATAEDRKNNYEGKLLGSVPAHPFMRPAFAAGADKAIEVVVEEIQAFMRT